MKTKRSKKIKKKRTMYLRRRNIKNLSPILPLYNESKIYSDFMKTKKIRESGDLPNNRDFPDCLFEEGEDY